MDMIQKFLDGDHVVMSFSYNSAKKGPLEYVKRKRRGEYEYIIADNYYTYRCKRELTEVIEVLQ